MVLLEKMLVLFGHIFHFITTYVGLERYYLRSSIINLSLLELITLSHIDMIFSPQIPKHKSPIRFYFRLISRRTTWIQISRSYEQL